MILSTHFIAGAAVASKTDNPLILVASALALHFVLDVIPHWQYIYTTDELKNKKIQVIVAADLLAGPLLAIILTGTTDIYRLLWLWLGGLFCMLPDFFVVLSIIFPKNKVFEKMLDFHEYIQKYAHQERLLGIITQLAVIFLAFWILV